MALSLFVGMLSSSARAFSEPLPEAGAAEGDTVLSRADSSVLAQLITVVELMKLEAREDSLRAELDAVRALQLEYRDNWALWPAVLAVLIVVIWSSRAFSRRPRAG